MDRPEGGHISLDEAVEMLGLSRPEIYRRVLDKTLKGEKIDRRLWFPPDEVRRYAGELEKDRRLLREVVEKWLSFFAGKLEKQSWAVMTDVSGNDTGEQVAEIGERVLQDALRAGARDVHLDPLHEGMRLLYNVGRCREVARFEACLREPLVAWLTGLTDLKEGGTSGIREDMLSRSWVEPACQMRLTEIPTALGSHFHIHLFTGCENSSLENLGYTSDQTKRIRQDFVSRPGLILQIGSGTPEDDRNRITMAREWAESGRLVVCVDHRTGFRAEQLIQLDLRDTGESNAEELWRTAFRMSPNVLVVDDVRDAAEARALVEGVRGGAVVLAQVSAANLQDALRKLAEFEIDATALGRAFLGAVEKAVVRRLCTECSRRRPISPDEAERIGIEEGIQVGMAVGCQACGDGFSGSRQVYGLWTAGTEIATWIAGSRDCPPRPPDGPESLTAALRKAVRDGEATPDEVIAFFP
ncbi:MAG: ATPase, T2SS/T4P/T4SS family [Gemmatimonadota bacterium]|nr:ATPase, T2SS/T4P/T4SS family [Gemmatimonadota bacterium]